MCGNYLGILKIIEQNIFIYSFAIISFTEINPLSFID